jgi:hypothetical protein
MACKPATVNVDVDAGGTVVVATAAVVVVVVVVVVVTEGGDPAVVHPATAPV